MFTIPNPNYFVARQIAKTRAVYAQFRSFIKYDRDTDTFLSWDESVLGPQPTQAELDALYIEMVREMYVSETGKARYELEINGIDYNGKTIPTDIETQNKINILQMYVTIRPAAIVKFKRPNGRFIDLNANQVNAVAEMVNDHVQACFSREAEIVDLIDAATTKAELDALIPDIENFSY